MAEYIERASVMYKLTLSETQKELREMDGDEAYSFFVSLINNEPVADVAPVVRCKDCECFMEYTKEHAQSVEGADGDCYIRVMNSDDRQFCGVRYIDFCSYGERKDGDT